MILLSIIVYGLVTRYGPCNQLPVQEVKMKSRWKWSIRHGERANRGNKVSTSEELDEPTLFLSGYLPCLVTYHFFPPDDSRLRPSAAKPSMYVYFFSWEKEWWVQGKAEEQEHRVSRRSISSENSFINCRGVNDPLLIACDFIMMIPIAGKEEHGKKWETTCSVLQ